MQNEDAALLKRWTHSHDAEAFNTIVQSYVDLVFSTAMRILRNEADANDIVQECFLNLAQKPEKVRTSLPGWLHSLATSRSLDLIRQRTRRQAREKRFSESPAAEKEYTWSDIQEYVDEAIEQLPEDLRGPVVEHFLQQKSHTDVAIEYGVTRQAISYRINKGVERIRENLLKKGVTLSAAALTTMLSGELIQAAPITLKASLAKFAISGASESISNAAGISNSNWLGSLLNMKVAALTALVIIPASLFAFRALQNTPEPVPPVSQATQLDTSNNSTAQNTTDAPRADLNPQTETQLAANAGGQDTPSAPENPAQLPSIAGFVIDHENNPIAGATVHARRIENDRTVGNPETTSNEDGTFAFFDVEPAERVYVYAKKDGMVRATSFTPNDFTPFTPPLSEVKVVLYPAATVSGRVVDTNGAPVREKQVTARFHDPRGALMTEASTTDTTGHFEVTGLSPGTHSVTVIPERQVTTSLEDVRVELTPGETRSNIEIVYTGKDFVVAGQVVDERGRPVSKAFVQIHGVDGPGPRDDYTDKDGRFSLQRIPNGSYSGMVTHQGHENQWITAKAGDSELVFVLKSQALKGLRGRVLDASTGEPIPRFDVQVMQYTTSEMYDTQFGLFETIEDPNGEFSLPGVRPRDVTVIARSPGMELKYEHIDLSGGPAGSVTVRLKPSKQAVGRVVTEAGSPVSDAYLLLSPYLYSTLSMRHDDTDMLERNSVARSQSTGEFVIDSLIPDLKVITAYHADHGVGYVSVSNDTVEDDPLEITLLQGATLRGRVTMGDVPQENADVRILTRGPFGESLGMSTTNENGEFSIAYIPEGKVKVSARLESSIRSMRPFTGRQAILDLTFANNETVVRDFAFPPNVATVAGAVTVAGEPPIGGEAYLTIETSIGPETNVTHIESDGTFAFNEVPPGYATLAVVAGLDLGEGSSGLEEFLIEPDSEYRVDIDVAAGQSVSGKIAGLRSEENMVTVTAYQGDLGPITTGSGFTIRNLRRGSASADTDGTFNLEGLEPGTYTLRVSAVELNARNEFISSRSDQLVVEVPSGQDVRITDIRLR